MNFNTDTGLELAQRAALLQLFDHLDDAISAVEQKWAESDETLADHMGLPYVPVEIERIEAQNFYEGHRPSLILAPIENYPNVSVWGVRSTPHAESDASDHTNIFSNLIFVEVMCKALDGEEGLVNKRVVRTSEAIHAVMRDDPTLGAVMTGFEGDVSLNLSDVFTRREQTSYGDLWYWQGARLEYVVRKDSVIAGSQQLASAPQAMPDGMTPADLALIDQS